MITDRKTFYGQFFIVELKANKISEYDELSNNRKFSLGKRIKGIFHEKTDSDFTNRIWSGQGKIVRDEKIFFTFETYPFRNVQPSLSDLKTIDQINFFDFYELDRELIEKSIVYNWRSIDILALKIIDLLHQPDLSKRHSIISIPDRLKMLERQDSSDDLTTAQALKLLATLCNL